MRHKVTYTVNVHGQGGASKCLAGHSGDNISSIMHLRLANMLMWQAIKEERDGYSNIRRYRNIINVMLLCVMHGNK